MRKLLISEKNLWREIRRRLPEEIEGLTMYDRNLFASCVRRSREIIGKMLSAILRRSVAIVDATVESFSPNMRGRSSIFDARAIGADGEVYDIEIQRDRSRFSARRTRYHQAQMDTGLLESGENYDSLSDACVLVIFESGLPPPFRDGRPVHILGIRDEKTGRELGDGMAIVLVDGSYRGEDELGIILRDLGESDPDKIVTGEIKEQMLYFKKGEGRKEMSESMERLMEMASKIGEEKGRAENSREIADRMSSQGFSNEDIFRATGIKIK